MKQAQQSHEEQLDKAQAKAETPTSSLIPAFLNRRQKQVLQMQRTHGNTAVRRWIQRQDEENMDMALIQEETAKGKPAHMHSGGPTEVSPQAEQKSEFDEMDGEVASNVRPHLFMDFGRTGHSTLETSPVSRDGKVRPHVFVDGGKTGSAIVHWAGGGGGVGNQGVGSITLAAPVYRSAEPSAPGGTAKAWIEAGSGTATVTRSYTGVVVGANNTYWFTAAASARADVHEQLHVNSSRAIHDTNIVPLQTRVAARTGEPKALQSGATGADAITALKAEIQWDTSVKAFSDQDTAANTPMGTTDTADLAAPDFIRDYGPRTVGGVNYDHYMDVPPGPGPVPAPAPGGGGGASPNIFQRIWNWLTS